MYRLQWSLQTSLHAIRLQSVKVPQLVGQTAAGAA